MQKQNGARTLAPVLAAIVLWTATAVTASAAGDDQPLKNLELFQKLAGIIGRRVAQALPAHDSSTLSLTFHPDGTAWIVQGPLARGIDSSGSRLRVSGGVYQADCVVSNLTVTYDDLRRDGFLGRQVLDREVTVRLAIAVLDRQSGRYVVNDTFEEGIRDTIDLVAVGMVEDAGVPATHGSLPGGGFFSWFLEPVIMLGAVAISVYMLFHVRS